MIAVDTSALVAIVLDEVHASSCLDAIGAERHLLISAGTVAEALIVAGHRAKRAEMQRLIDGLGFEIVDVTPQVAGQVADAHARWGIGSAEPALNLGDCFAYALAKDRRCRLLYVGHDFSRTDIESVL